MADELGLFQGQKTILTEKETRNDAIGKAAEDGIVFSRRGCAIAREGKGRKRYDRAGAVWVK